MSTEPTFSRWLRERRSELGITQEEFSDRLGFSAAMLRKLESGERRPSGQIASLLATYFHVPADEEEAFVAFARTGQGASTAGEATSVTASPLRPWRSVYMRQTNLPAMLTHLIGREHEEQTAHDLLLHPKTRLLTLTGTAGIGKTRLALQIASRLFEHFDDGIYFVDLAPVADPDAVVQAVAHTLGLQEESSPSAWSLESVLIEYVRGRRMLLVLDNFEQVLDASPSLVALMQASPWLKALVTSREALHVRGERRFPVPPLHLPDLESLPGLEVLAGYPSIELFLERAQEVAPDFALTQHNAMDVASVCVGLEGLPLAIELAASRANHLTPAYMASALGTQLKLLVGGARDVPARHRTLRAAIEWSHKLLDQDEQRLFRQLSVFVGGVTAEAIEAATYENRTDAPRSALDIMASLVDKSLVHRERDGKRPAETRFRLLEAVREYAIEQLEEVDSGKGTEAAEMRRKHAEYYLSLADRAEKHFTGPQYEGWGAEQIEWIDRLETDLDNMRLALDWYQAQARGETRGQTEYETFSNLEKGLRLAGDLRRIWLGRGYRAEGLQRLSSFFSMIPAPLPAGPRELRASYALALLVMGRLASSQQEVEQARARLEGAFNIFVELNDKQLMANVLLVLGSLALTQGDYDATRSYQVQCLENYRGLGNRWGTGAALDDLGYTELEEGNFALARPLLQESLVLYQAVGELFGAASVFGSLGLVAYYQKDYRAAYDLWTESLRMSRDVGARNRSCDSLVMLGRAAAHLGDHDQARSLLKQGLTTAWQIRALFTIYQALTGLGMLASLRNNPEQAALLFGAAEALRRSEQLRLSPSHRAEVDSEVSTAQIQLDEDEWNRTWALGSSIPLEEVVAALLT